MDINDIKTKYTNLNNDLRKALSTMEKTDAVKIIRDQIRELQLTCPHNNGEFDFSKAKECPYCGRKF